MKNKKIKELEKDMGFKLPATFYTLTKERIEPAVFVYSPEKKSSDKLIIIEGFYKPYSKLVEFRNFES